MKYFVPVFVFAGALVSTSAVFAPNREPLPVTIVATGDVMLGRTVEEVMLSRGFDYPFAHTKEIFSGADVVFANLEGPVPSAHEKTPPYSFHFSFLPESIRAMKNAGVNAVTLANNHTVDFGEQGYDDTVKKLKEEKIFFTGHPTRIGEDIAFEKTIRGHTVRFVGFNDTYTPLDIEKTSELVRRLKKDGKKDDVFLVVAVHWGEEYKNVSNKRQQTLGHALIDAGADVVIGHHPHVAEEVERYKGKMIFYSLGNFIFDQYFSEQTQKAFAVRILINEGGGKAVSYELIPVDLRKSQPKKMNEEDTKRFLFELSERSARDVSSDIASGRIE